MLDNFNIQAWNYRRRLQEHEEGEVNKTFDDIEVSKGYTEAIKVINKLRATIFRGLSDEELQTFRKTIANSLDMMLK